MTGEVHRTGELSNSGGILGVVVSALVLEFEFVARFRHAISCDGPVRAGAGDVINESAVNAPGKGAGINREALAGRGSLIIVIVPGCLFALIAVAGFFTGVGRDKVDWLTKFKVGISDAACRVDVHAVNTVFRAGGYLISGEFCFEGSIIRMRNPVFANGGLEIFRYLIQDSFSQDPSLVTARAVGGWSVVRRLPIRGKLAKHDVITLRQMGGDRHAASTDVCFRIKSGAAHSDDVARCDFGVS